MTQPADAILWPHNGPVLDQGKVGSCTGNAVTQWSNTDYARNITGRTAYLTEDDAVKAYTLATELDGINGDYPSEDTGSTGDAACNAAVKLGWICGYRNVKPTVDSIVAALRHQPLIVGSNWDNSMFTTDANGVVVPDGNVSGGHEYVILGFALQSGLFTCLNSWADTWGVNGRFYIHFNDLVSLLNADGTAVTAPLVGDLT